MARSQGAVLTIWRLLGSWAAREQRAVGSLASAAQSRSSVEAAVLPVPSQHKHSAKGIMHGDRGDFELHSPNSFQTHLIYRVMACAESAGPTERPLEVRVRRVRDRPTDPEHRQGVRHLVPLLGPLVADSLVGPLRILEKVRNAALLLLSCKALDFLPATGPSPRPARNQFLFG